MPYVTPTDAALPRIPRVEALIAQMTPLEKAGQLSQTALHAPADEAIRTAVQEGRVGSFLNAPDLAHRNELQRIAVEQSRLKIPLIFGRDVIHGYRTIFPIPLGQGATFDPDLVERAAEVAAAEATEAGIDWVFAPMVDVARDPRWGRVAEGCGEDPLLTARMGAAMVRGFQGKELGQRGRVAACAKHFAAYGATEGGKEYNTTWVPEQLLREIYLRPFQACVEAGVATLMTAFNDLNGTPASAHMLLLRTILKGEWGFDGFVVSDWASIHEMIFHGNCADDRDAALQGANAGVDMDMASRCYPDHLPELAGAGVDMSVVDEAVRRVLLVKHRLGLFDRPFADAPKVSVALSETHRAIARQVVRESLVLLKNDGPVLPLSPSIASLAVVGPLADDGAEQLGCWSFDGRAADSITALAAMRDRLGARGAQAIRFAKGLPDARSMDTSGFDAAVRAAQGAEAIVAFVGENANLSGECRSRAFLDLPGAQLALLERLAKTGRPLVLVVMAGRPLVIGPVADLASAVLYAWHPGTMAGPGIADVLFGDVAPSGKLPISFPRAVGQIPVYYNYKNTGRPPSKESKGIPTGTPLDPVGFEATYLDVEVTPQFPFGFGLSYTRFAYEGMTVLPAKPRVGDSITVRATVRNTGDVAGTEVVQLYVRDRVGSVTRPVRELKAFRRVSLQPGESQAVELTLTEADLSFPGHDMKPTIEPGTFDLFVGGDSRAALTVQFDLARGPSR